MNRLTRGEISYLTVTSPQTIRDVIKAIDYALPYPVFEGQIIAIDRRYRRYEVRMGDTYDSLAETYGTDASELSKINNDVSLYPTLAILLPRGTEENHRR